MEPENWRDLRTEILTCRNDRGQRPGIIGPVQKRLFYGEIQEDG